jgi:hypothetical protein
MTNRSWLFAVFGLVLGVENAYAVPITLTFDGTGGASYTEQGMTITPIEGSSVVSTSSYLYAHAWNFNLGFPSEKYELSTGALFDLLSIKVIHSDGGIVFDGYSGSTMVVSQNYSDHINFGEPSQILTLTGFTALDRATVSVFGEPSDPIFDDLTYRVHVPEPASLALWSLGVVGFGLTRRRRKKV